MFVAIRFPTQARVEEVAEEQIFALGMVDGPSAMCWGLVSVLFYAQYKIDRKRHAEIQMGSGR